MQSQFVNNMENNDINNQSSENPPIFGNIPRSLLKKENISADETYHSSSTYRTIQKNILNGNIVPDGPLEPTPENIKVELKIHQQRMLFEMLAKEDISHRVTSSINAFCVADKVGAGKSLEILSLISKRPTVEKLMPNRLIYNISKYSNFKGFSANTKVELKSNLIVIPHGIYGQWIEYIQKFTNCTYFGISFSRDIPKLDLQKVIDGDYQIILVKSTRYNDLMDYIYDKFPEDFETNSNTIFDKITYERLNDLTEKLRDLHNDIRDRYFNGRFMENFDFIKEKINTIDQVQLNENIKNSGKYTLPWIKEWKGPIFERVIIDEANSIKIPRCRAAYGKVNWFITSSVKDLLVPYGSKDWVKNKILINGIKGSGFIKNVFIENSGDRKSNFIQDMYLKNSDSFVEDSFQLPEPNHIKISCFTPPELKALEGVAIPEVIQALNAGDVDSAIEQVGCQVHSESNIVDIVLKNLTDEFDSKSKLLENKNSKLETTKTIIETLSEFTKNLKSKLIAHSVDPTIVLDIDENELTLDEKLLELNSMRSMRSSLNSSIKLLTGQLKNLKFKIDSLTERISNIEDKNCPICSEKVSNPCITPCCKNVFCFQCITMAFNFTPDKCPLCRSKVTLSSLTAISDKKCCEETKTSLPTKINSLISIIKSNPGGRFLVFSKYDNSFQKIQQTLDANDITFSKLSGSSGRVKNIIKKYSNNEIQVLLLNAKHYGSGLNLQMTTDIIIYHRMSNELEKQIIGRGQRLGRTSRLNVNYLCYDNEL